MELPPLGCRCLRLPDRVVQLIRDERRILVDCLCLLPRRPLAQSAFERLHALRLRRRPGDLRFPG